jgi:prepilin-type N-terminal cleavage/methylation domain-containing protein
MIFREFRHGFTVAEMMIVIVILGIIFASMNYLSPGPKISRTKSERIATAVQDSIKSAQRDIITGKSPSFDAPIVKKTVTISV